MGFKIPKPPGGISVPEVIIFDGGSEDSKPNGKPNQKVSAGSNNIAAFNGKGGNDTLTGGARGGDRIYGDTGNDLIKDLGSGKSNGGDNQLDGGEGNDTIIAGGGGIDIIVDGDGNDVVKAGDGHNIINGAGGNDRYEGGKGEDNYTLVGYGFDTILDAGGNDDSFASAIGTVEMFQDAIVLGQDSDGDGNFNDLYIEYQGFAGKYQYLIKNFFDDKSKFQEGAGKGTGAIEKFTFGLINHGFEGIKDYVDNWSDPNGTYTTVGGAGKDTKIGDVYHDIMFGGDGNDTLSGMGNSDTLDGGIGNDKLDGGNGDDTLLGDDGNDTLIGGAGYDTLTGGAGNDLLQGGDDDDTYNIDGQGTDKIQDSDSVEGDSLFFEIDGLDEENIGDLTFNAVDLFNGSKAGTDKKVDSLEVFNDGVKILTIEKFFNNNEGYTDLLTAGSGVIENWNIGSDVLDFEDVVDLLDNIQATTEYKLKSLSNNSKKGDNAKGTAYYDQINGQGGNDTILGLAGKDILDGGTGNDKLDGGDGDDSLYGGVGNDSLIGGKGNDTLYGDVGKDNLQGGDNDDEYFYDLSLSGIEGISGAQLLGDVIKDTAGTNDSFVFEGADVDGFLETFHFKAVDLFKGSKSGKDGKIDSLQILDGSDKVVLTIQNFFNNTVAVSGLDSGDAGAGAIEYFNFENAESLDFGDIIGYVNPMMF